MTRARVGIGILAVVSGTVWALGGIDALTTNARRLAELLPLILVLAGLSAILLVAVPGGTLTGPILLISMGLLGLALEHGLLSRVDTARLPAFIISGAGAIIAMSRRQKIAIDTGIERHTAFIFPLRRHLSGDAPMKIIARAVSGFLQLDMSRANYPPGAARLWVDVTCVMGCVELILPSDWEVQAGRIELARQMKFRGTLASSSPAPLSEIGDQPEKKLVVINAMGWGGTIVVQRN